MSKSNAKPVSAQVLCFTRNQRPLYLPVFTLSPSVFKPVKFMWHSQCSSYEIQSLQNPSGTVLYTYFITFFLKNLFYTFFSLINLDVNKLVTKSIFLTRIFLSKIIGILQLCCCFFFFFFIQLWQLRPLLYPESHSFVLFISFYL